MSVRITTLVENSTDRMGLLAEHGLSLLIESHREQILFDTGQTGIVVHNARALGLDLTRVQVIALSHGHEDHSGGLRDALREVGRGRREVRVVAHPGAFGPHFSLRKDERVHYSGIPFSLQAVEGEGVSLRLSETPTEIVEGVWLTGEVPMRTSYESVASSLKMPDGSRWRQDPMLDDQALVIRTEAGLVVALGCAHRGMVNTLEFARQITGEERIVAVVGGTHLGPASEDQLQETIGALKGLGIGKLGVSHCTGLKAAARLAHEFGDAFFFNVTGTVTELP
jgi:7,8-dihydropterin-6-yl-methyl-4-(beta-D-ribofuranosyl)aminobenzene 5'-phosphate synthase